MASRRPRATVETPGANLALKCPRRHACGRMPHARSFASDNNSGVHPKVLEALARVNQGHVVAYGDDVHTQRATRRIQELLGEHAQVFFVFNGTAANVLGLKAMTHPWHGVICSDGAHIQMDECGAPERFLGGKLLPVAAPDGKLTVERVKPLVKGIGDQHHIQPKVISITQSTELGSVYTPAEVRTLAQFAHENGMMLHMDGARVANAAAALGGSIRDFTTNAGVDVLSLGGTKNGLLGAEAVILLRPELAADFRFIRKQGMQLASKMRYLAAQFEAFLDDDLWLQNARHANAMARLLAQEASKVPGVKLARQPEANAVFGILPPDAIARLQQEWFFYVWDAARHEVRWVCSWDTTEEDVRGFVSALRQAMSSS